MTAAHKCLEGKSSVKGKIMAGRWVGSTLYRMELWNIHLEKKWYIFWKTSKDKIKKKTDKFQIKRSNVFVRKVSKYVMVLTAMA